MPGALGPLGALDTLGSLGALDVFRPLEAVLPLRVFRPPRPMRVFRALHPAPVVPAVELAVVPAVGAAVFLTHVGRSLGKRGGARAEGGEGRRRNYRSLQHVDVSGGFEQRGQSIVGIFPTSSAACANFPHKL